MSRVSAFYLTFQNEVVRYHYMCRLHGVHLPAAAAQKRSVYTREGVRLQLPSKEARAGSLAATNSYGLPVSPGSCTIRARATAILQKLETASVESGEHFRMRGGRDDFIDEMAALLQDVVDDAQFDDGGDSSASEDQVGNPDEEEVGAENPWFLNEGEEGAVGPGEGMEGVQQLLQVAGGACGQAPHAFQQDIVQGPWAPVAGLHDQLDVLQ
jgi:hypothetical protein